MSHSGGLEDLRLEPPGGHFRPPQVSLLAIGHTGEVTELVRQSSQQPLFGQAGGKNDLGRGPTG